MTGKRYRVVAGKYSRLEGGVRVRYRLGDIFTPTAEEIQKLGRMIQPVIESPSTIDEVEDPKPQTTGPEPVKVKVEDLDQLLKHTGGGWYVLSPNGERVKGKENARERLKGYLRKYYMLEE